MRKGNPGLLKFIGDEDSCSGISAAILLRNVRPKRLKNGDYKVVYSEFPANFHMNCEGFRVRPKVMVSVFCQLSELQSKQAKKQRELDAALRGAPILK